MNSKDIGILIVGSVLMIGAIFVIASRMAHPPYQSPIAEAAMRQALAIERAATAMERIAHLHAQAVALAMEAR